MRLNNVEQTKLVIIRGSGNIPELGNICAPVLTPQNIPVGKLAKIISSGLVVMEVNPKNRNESVRLTISNLRTANFAEEQAAPEVKPAEVAPKAAEKPVAPAPVVAKKEEKKTEVKAEPAKVEAKTEKASDFTAK